MVLRSGLAVQRITIRLCYRGANSYAQILENGSWRNLNSEILINNSFTFNNIFNIGTFNGHNANCNIDLNAFKIYVDDMMVVNFMSVDQSINTGIACTAENTLAEVEEKLYQMYNEYRNTNNILMHKGNIALRFKKIKENKIKNGDKIIIDIPQ